ncbi:MAG: hypothetical protein IJS42_03310 [Synergistaceae bacterium]|nr:hypothetical protein [Synergistaceae bacterium]
MNKNLYMVFAGLFFSGCLALMFAVWYSIHVLYDYRTEYETLEAEQNNFTGMIKNLEERNRTLSQIAGLDINRTGTVSDSVSFYSQVRLAIENSGMNLLSMSSGQNEKDLKLSLSLQGSYYSLAHLIAAWRVMPSASRILSLRFKRDPQSPEYLIDAEVTIEGMISDE